MTTQPAPSCRICTAAEYASIDLGIGPLDQKSVERLYDLMDAAGSPHDDDDGTPCVTEADLNPTPEEQDEAMSLAYLEGNLK